MVLVVALVWFVWPRGDRRSRPERGRRRRDGNGNGTAVARAATGHRRNIVPGENPIEHVVFLVKENRSFDHYFGRYPGVDGATEGGTMNCSTFDGCRRPCRSKDAPP